MYDRSAEEARVAAMVDSPYLPAEGVRTARGPGVGYLMVMGAAVLFAVNGTVSKVVLESGVTSLRLTQIRCLGALVGLGLIVLLARPQSLRTTRRELAFLVVFGVCGVALVQLFYFAAIARLEIGVSLLIQYTAPLLVALWARFVFKERVRSRVWAALALALVGLSVMVDVWGGVPLNTAGVVLSFISAATFAAYLLLAEHAVGRRDPFSLLVYGFLFASLFWAVAQPWWSFPRDELGETISLLGNLSGYGASGLDARARHRRGRDDRPVHAHGRLAPAPARDHGRHGGDAGAGARSARRLPLAGRVARGSAARGRRHRARRDLPRPDLTRLAVADTLFTKQSDRCRVGALGDAHHGSARARRGEQSG